MAVDKYGHIKGGKTAVGVPVAASQTFKAKSGRFVYMVAGAATLNTDAIGSIFGHAEMGDESPSTGDIINVIVDPSTIYRIPIDSGTYVVGMIGDQCDINITSDIQGAQLDASAENTLTVVGGDAVDNAYVDVMITPTEWGTGIGVDA